MDSVGAFEAKTHLPRLLDRVARGESVTITRHGRPVARLVPVEDSDRDRANRAMHAYLPPHMQDHARLIKLDSGGWVIQTDSPAWATRLRYVLPELRRQLGEHFKTEIPKLQVKVRPQAEKQSPPGRRIELNAKNADLLRGVAANVSDQRLGDALMRLAKRASA